MVNILERARFIGGDQDEPEQLVDGQLVDGQLGDELPELDPDPAPGRKVRRRPKAETSKATAARQPRSGGRFMSTKAQKQAIADEIDLYAKMLALTWSLSDPDCAEVLNETSRDIAASAAKLIGRSEWLMEMATRTSLFGDVSQLLMKLYPLFKAMRAHGHFRRGGVEHEDQDQEVTGAAGTDAARYPAWRPAYA